jgi:SAM-dependent methyltransferase
MPNEGDKRINNEANFQNNRLKKNRDEPEARAKYYYLSHSASDYYNSQIQNIEGKKVLVVGCSIGGVTPLARRGAYVTGIDISQKAIDMLSEAIVSEGLEDKAKVVLMNAENLSFENEKFDIICCKGVLHHLLIDKALDNWSRFLKKDGKIVMVEPMAYNPAAAIYRMLTPEARTPDEHPLIPSDFKIMSKYFEKSIIQGYALTSVLSIIFVPFKLEKLKCKSAKLLESIDIVLLKILPFLNHLCWTTVIILSKPKF